MPSNKIDSNIIDKIKNIVHYAQSHVIEETEQHIYESFPTDDLYITESSINTAYYQEYLKKIYIKGLDGIHFKFDKGPWDILGENTSHTGTDLSLESPLSSKSSILLYDKNFFQNEEDYDSQIDEMINNISYNEENIISALRDNDVELLNVISKDHINEKVLDFFLEDLDEKAESKYIHLKNDRDISPYGGIDIKVLSKSNILYNDIKKIEPTLKEIGAFEKARNFYLSNQNNVKYLNEELKKNKQLLYIINHKEEYIFNREIEHLIEDEPKQLSEYDISELNNMKYDLEYNYDYLLQDLWIEYSDPYTYGSKDFEESFNRMEAEKIKAIKDIVDLERFSETNEFIQGMNRSEDKSFSDDLKTYDMDEDVINTLRQTPYNYIELPLETQSVKEVQKFVLDTIDLETRYEYLESIQGSLGHEDRFIIPLKQRYLSYLEGFKDTPLYENATKEMLVTKEGRSFVHDRLNKINDFLDLTTNDQDFKDFSTYTTRLFTIENAIEQRNLDLENLQFDKDTLSNSLDDLSKQKPRFWQFNRKNELKKSILKTEDELHTTDKKIHDIKEDIKKLEVDKADLKTTLSSDKYLKISESLHNIDDLKLVTSYSIINNLQKYQDHFNQDKETLESALAHNPYNQSLEMNIKINSSSITGIDKQLSDINEVLKQAESNPDKYDLQINFDIDNNRIIRNQCIDQSDIKKISSELASNSKTAILKLAKNMIKDQGEDQKERVEQIDNITNKLNEPVEEVIEVDVAIKPAIAF